MLKKTALVVLAVLLAAAVIVMAQPGPGGRAGKHDGSCMTGGMPGGGMGCGMACGKGHGMGRGMGRGMNDDMMPGGGMGMERILKFGKKLELTDAQIQKIKDMQQTFQLERVDRGAALKKAEIKLRTAMMDEKVSEADVAKQIDAVAGLRADMAKMRYHHMTTMRAVLTDKQRDMLKEMTMESRKDVQVRVIEKRGAVEEDSETQTESGH